MDARISQDFNDPPNGIFGIRRPFRDFRDRLLPVFYPTEMFFGNENIKTYLTRRHQKSIIPREFHRSHKGFFRAFKDFHHFPFQVMPLAAGKQMNPDPVAGHGMQEIASRHIYRCFGFLTVNIGISRGLHVDLSGNGASPSPQPEFSPAQLLKVPAVVKLIENHHHQLARFLITDLQNRGYLLIIQRLHRIIIHHRQNRRFQVFLVKCSQLNAFFHLFHLGHELKFSLKV